MATSVLDELKLGQVIPCQVCGHQMGKEVKAFSYGGICCLSCRAFFRRCHQESKEPILFCRTNGHCELKKRTPQRCAKCRREACLRIGMRPELVLTHQEKEIKFKKAREKKKEAAKKNAVEQEPSGRLAQKQNGGGKKVIAADESEQKHAFKLPSSAQAGPSCSFGNMESLSEESLGQGMGTSMVRNGTQGLIGPTTTHQEISLQIQKAESIDFAQSDASVASSSIPPKAVIEPRDILGEALNGCMDDFQRVAESLKSAVRCPEDWTKLVRQNRKLWVNYALGQFLTVEQWECKVQWITPMWNKSFLANSLDLLKDRNDSNILLNEVMGLFDGDVVMQSVFLGFARSLSDFGLSTQYKAKLMGVLFLYPGNASLSNSLSTYREFLLAIQELGTFSGSPLPMYEIHEAGRTLEAMSVMLEHSNFARKYLPKYSEDLDLLGGLINSGFTQEEAAWLCYQKNLLLQTTSSSPPIASDQINELINYATKGTPLTYRFLHHTTLIANERFWRLYKLHHEFNNLSDFDQAKIVFTSRSLFGILLAAMVDGMPLDELAHFGFSIQDALRDCNLRMVLEASPEQCQKMRPISMKYMYPMLPAAWDEGLERVQSFVRQRNDYFSFFAILITVLFDSIGSTASLKPTWQPLANVGRRYQMALARKMGGGWGEFERQIRATMVDMRVLVNIQNAFKKLQNTAQASTG